MTRYISTKETAAMLRQVLATTWPGVKFSVRKGTGTGSAWIDVTYWDGPTRRQLREVLDRYEGSRFNGMTDSYDVQPNVLLATPGSDLPEEVSFVTDGINSHRCYSPAARLHAQHILDTLGHGDIRTCTEDGEPLHVGNVPQELTLPEHHYSYIYSPAGLAEAMLGDLDLFAVTGQGAR